VNRAGLEKSVGASQSAVAEEVARGSERFVLQAVSSLRFSASILPLGELSPQEVASVLRIPYRELDFLDAVQLLTASGTPLSPAIFESGNGRPAPLVDALPREAPLAAAAPVTALGWTVLMAQPAKLAQRPAALVRNYTLFWLWSPHSSSWCLAPCSPAA
jgi:hypothetical protein